MSWGGMLSMPEHCDGSDCAHCDNPCLIASDAFASDAIASYATTGSPTITGGVLELNANDGVLHNTAAASEDDATRVTFTIDTADDPATIRALIAATDFSNYLYGEVDVDSTIWTIIVGRRVGGTDTEYTTAVEIDTPTLPATVCLSWHPGETQTPEEFVISGVFPTSVSDNGGGLGSWASVNNVLGDDGSVATYTFTSTGSAQSADALVVQWTGLAVPPGSTIDGIAVTVQVSGGGGVYNVIDEFAQLESGLGTYDNNATGGAFGSAEERTYGGATDNWGGVTWEDLPTLAFLFVLKRDAGFTGGTALVDYVGELSIWFTTPERTPGRLRVSINGECVTEYSAEVPVSATGLKAGVRSQAGDWDVDDFDYSYAQSEAKPSCPTCECDVEEAFCPNCIDNLASEELVVNLGTVELTEGHCSCTTIDGAYVVPFAFIDTSGGDDTDFCWWVLNQYINCGVNTVLFTIVVIRQGAQWLARVSLVEQETGDGEAAQYESELDEGDCTAMPVTLSKSGGGGTLCGGSFPDTITIDVP